MASTPCAAFWTVPDGKVFAPTGANPYVPTRRPGAGSVRRGRTRMKPALVTVAAALVSYALAQVPAPQAPAPCMGRIASFESEADNPFTVQNTNISVTRVREHASDGSGPCAWSSRSSAQPHPGQRSSSSNRVELVGAAVPLMDLYVEGDGSSTTAYAASGAQGRHDAVRSAGWGGCTRTSRSTSGSSAGICPLTGKPVLHVPPPGPGVVYTIDNVRWEMDEQKLQRRSVYAWRLRSIRVELRDDGHRRGGLKETVADPGDFKAGQGIVIQPRQRPLRQPATASRQPLQVCAACRQRRDQGLTQELACVLAEVDENPATLAGATTWRARGRRLPITYDWQALSNRVEVKFKRQEWKISHMVSARRARPGSRPDREVEGNRNPLRDVPNRSCTGARCASHYWALQDAINKAVKEAQPVLPRGYYRLAGSLRVANANITIEGQSAGNVCARSQRQGRLLPGGAGGGDVTIRNFAPGAHGPGGRPARSACPTAWTASGPAPSRRSAITVTSTERVLIEDHAARPRKAALRQAPCTSTNEPRQLTKSLT